MRILIVDDFNVGRITIKNILFELGYENTIEASNGYCALASLKSKIIDCVISEWEMPEMSGLELLKNIREDHLLKKIPVLISTKVEYRDNIVSASRAGASGFLFKPFKKEDFSEKLFEIFQRS